MNNLTEKILDYQQQALEFAIYPNKGNNRVYPALGFISEVGEFAGKLKKIMRDKGGVITEDDRLALLDELGDICWYVVVGAFEDKYELAYRYTGKFSDGCHLANRLTIGINNLLEYRVLHPDSFATLLAHCEDLARLLSSDLPTVLDNNIAKLKSRQERGKLQGSGDNR